MPCAAALLELRDAVECRDTHKYTYIGIGMYRERYGCIRMFRGTYTRISKNQVEKQMENDMKTVCSCRKKVL